jgi:hypothetical protein
VLLLAGVGIIKATMNSGRAERFASDAAVRIGNSNYSKDVIERCKADAKEYDYDLLVDLIYEKGTNRVEYGSLTLRYSIDIPIINIKQKQAVEADIM